MKKLGQYFLVNKEKVRVILDGLQLSREDFLIEIGPGRGAITSHLKNITLTTQTDSGNGNEEGEEKEGGELLSCLIAKLLKKNKETGNGIKVVAIEKDAALADSLEKEMGGGVAIIHGDALRELPKISAELARSGIGYKVAGNIPYYITGRLFRVLSDLRWKPGLTVLMIQKEVAERVCAAPPRMNILSACVQFWAEPAILGFVPRGDFSPKPKVDGGIVRLKLKDITPTTQTHAMNANEDEEKEKEKNYYRLVRALFKQPRKTILNNFQFSILNSQKNRGEAREFLESAGIKPEDRPQNLGIQDILRLRDKITPKTRTNAGNANGDKESGGVEK